MPLLNGTLIKTDQGDRTLKTLRPMMFLQLKIKVK